MKKLLLVTLLLTSCYDLSVRHKIQQDWSYYEIPEKRIPLDGEWDYKSECYYFYDTSYIYVEQINDKQPLITRGYYYVTVDDTMLYLLAPNRQGAVRYKVSVFDDSILIHITDTIHFTFINRNYVKESD